jgi:hypothetical protein
MKYSIDAADAETIIKGINILQKNLFINYKLPKSEKLSSDVVDYLQDTLHNLFQRSRINEIWKYND